MKILLIVVGLMIVARIALPYIIRSQINKKLAELPDYIAQTGDVSLSIFGGTFSIIDLEIGDRAETVEAHVPLIKANWSWSALLHKTFILSLVIREPRIRVELPAAEQEFDKRARKAEREKPKKPEPPVSDQLRREPAFKIDAFEIENGQIRLEIAQPHPPVMVFLREINFQTLNLTNRRSLDSSGSMLAVAYLRLKINETGEADMRLRFNPIARQPTFKLTAEVRNLHLPDMNPLIRAQTGFKMDSGSFSCVTEDAAAEGAFQGYVKPELKDAKLANPNKGKPLKSFAKSVMNVVTKMFSNKKGAVATRIPIQGRFDNPQIGLFEAVLNVLRNAFMTSITPTLEGRPTLEHVRQKAPQIKSQH